MKEIKLYDKLCILNEFDKYEIVRIVKDDDGQFQGVQCSSKDVRDTINMFYTYNIQTKKFHWYHRNKLYSVDDMINKKPIHTNKNVNKQTTLLNLNVTEKQIHVKHCYVLLKKLNTNKKNVKQSNAKEIKIGNAGHKDKKKVLEKSSHVSLKKSTRKAKKDAQEKIGHKSKSKLQARGNKKINHEKKTFILESKYDNIEFERSEFDTFDDFNRILKEEYLQSLRCRFKDIYCVNKNRANKFWCVNMQCKEVNEYTIKKRIELFWKLYTNGQRIEKPFIYTGRKDHKNNQNNESIPFQTLNITWCFFCGLANDLVKCHDCTASYHVKCPAQTIKNDQCPQCENDNIIHNIGVVWHKLKGFDWWPAQIIDLKMRPRSLKTTPSIYHCPVRYFQDNRYAFADIRELCQFKIEHNPSLNGNKNKKLQEAYQCACEELICQ